MNEKVKPPSLALPLCRDLFVSKKWMASQVFWILGDGRKASFWNDLLSYGISRDFASKHVNYAHYIKHGQPVMEIL